VTLLLSDGRRVRVRALTVDDEASLRRAFEHADPIVLRSRFGGGAPPFSTIAARLHQLNGTSRYAVAAFAEGGDVIGVAEYVQTEPEGPADVAVVVAQDWQRQGIGAAILGRLATHAAGAGITSFTAMVSGSNRQVLELVDDLPVPHSITYDHGSGTLHAELPRTL
jgi:GNAT superfamily N-acetyltransferase